MQFALPCYLVHITKIIYREREFWTPTMNPLK